MNEWMITGITLASFSVGMLFGAPLGFYTALTDMQRRQTKLNKKLNKL